MHNVRSIFFFGNFEVEASLANFVSLPIFYGAVNHSDEVSDYRLSGAQDSQVRAV